MKSEESRRREAEVSALLEASRSVLEYREFKDAARSIFDSCKKLIGATAGYVALLNRDGTENELLFLDSGGLPCTVEPTLPMPIRGLRAEAYHSVKTVYDNNFPGSEWVQFLPEGHAELHNVLFAPLTIKGKVAGLLGLANKPGGFTEDDARTATAFGELVATALHNSRTLEALENSEQRLRSLVETAADAIISANSRGNITLCNRRAESLFGYRSDELLGKPLTLIMPERFRDGHKKGMERLLSTGKPTIIGKTVELAGLRKDGSEFPLELSVAKSGAGDDIFFAAIIRDITERKRAEEDLQNLATFPGENPNPVIRVARDGTVIFANQSSRPLLELWRCAEGASLPPEPYRQVEGALETGKPIDAETDCGDRTFLITYAPIAGRDYVNIYSVDITERKRAEEVVRRSREDLDRAQEVGQVGSWRLDVGRNVLTWSDENHRIFGVPTGTPMSYETFLGIVHPDDQEYVDTQWKAGLRGEPYDIEHRIVVAGKVKWVREKAYLEFDDAGKLLGGFGITQDITERKQAEDRIRAQGDFLQRVLDSLNHPFYVVDANDHTIKLANTVTAAGPLSGSVPCYQLFHNLSEPCRGDENVCPLEVVKKTKAPMTVEHTHRNQDGTRRVVEVHCHPLFDDEGNVNQAIEYQIDVTERKRAEEALERLRSEFMGMVTHELKTPLTAIKGSAATALGSQRPLAVEENRELFEIIDEQADRLRELMDNLLDVTRIEAGTLSVNPEPTDLQGVLEEARATFARTGGRHEVRLEVPADMPRVSGDRRRLSQVLMNLLNNGAMFSPTTEPITIAVEHDSLEVTVRVRDRGRGIPREKLPLLFKKFSRVHDDTGRKVSGTGLGLAICKGIVETHGGRIWAESGGEGQGSTFSFTLPVASETGVQTLTDEARRAVHLGRVRRAGEKTRVLAVDDEPQILRFLQRSLDEAGYQPIVTSDPSQVAKLVELEEPDLVLLDLKLPGTSGFELLQRIREFSGVPVIFVTASDEEADTVRALKTGADDYITKPFSPSELLARIGVALRRRLLPDVAEARPPFVLGDLTINFVERQVSVAGHDVSLSATEYKILYELASHAGRALTYDRILQQVWGPEYSGETELVRSFIRNLRRKLGDDARKPRFILTERQVGYRMPKP